MSRARWESFQGAVPEGGEMCSARCSTHASGNTFWSFCTIPPISRVSASMQLSFHLGRHKLRSLQNVMVHAFSPRTWKIEAEESLYVQGQPARAT
ncbi:hypothetical protein ACRRTK_004978 [Alexandromys fortis]